VKLNRPDLGQSESLLGEIVRITKGEPFYLRFLTEDLSKVTGTVEVPTDLPQDARDYIARQVRGLQTRFLELVPEPLKHDRLKTAQAASLILRTLAVAPDWLSQEQVLEILAPLEPIVIQSLIPPLRRYVVTDRPAYAVDELNERYLVTPLKLREGIQRAFVKSELLEAEKKLLEYCRGWPQHRSTYSLKYLTYHLVSFDLYEELLDTLDTPFLQAKSVALKGTHSTLIDLDRGLWMCVERRDIPKAIRLLLLIARTRSAIERRAYYGGIALDAARRLYDIAIDSARAVGNPEIKFRMLLLVSEIALQQGDRDLAVEMLDETLTIEAVLLHFPKKDLDEYFHLLLTRYREVDRALALAKKLDTELDDYLQQACWATLEQDTEYAFLLADHIRQDHIWCDTHLQAARRLLGLQPELARKVLDRVLEQRHCDELAVAAVLREMDPSASLSLINEHLITIIPNGQSEFVIRYMDELVNRATAELAYLDVERAFKVALRCPEIVDSMWTRTTTLTHILRLASAKGVALDLTQLCDSAAQSSETDERDNLEVTSASEIARIPEPDRRTAISPAVADAFLGELAIQCALQSKAEDAYALYSRIEEPNTRAASAIHLHMRNARFERSKVQWALEEINLKTSTWNQVIAALKVWFARDSQSVQSIISLLASAQARFDVLHAILQDAPNYFNELEVPCLKAISQMDTAEAQVSALISLAEIARLPDTGRALLEKLVDKLPEVSCFAKCVQCTAAIELALRLGQSFVASRLVSMNLRYIEQEEGTEQQRRDNYYTLACLVTRERMVLEREAMLALLNAIGDPLTKGRLVALWSDGETYVNEQMLRSRLNLKWLLMEVFEAAGEHGTAEAMRLVRARLESEPSGTGGQSLDPIEMAILRMQEALALTKAEPETAKQRLEEAWSFTEDALRHLTDADNDEAKRVDRNFYEVLTALARVDQRLALERAEKLSVWYQHLAYADIGSMIRDDPKQARAMFQRARETARRGKLAVNRYNALWNVAMYSKEAWPEFATECLEEAWQTLAKMEADDRVAAQFRLIARGKSWPRRSRNEIWAQISLDLADVRWTLPDQDNIFAAAREIKDPEQALLAWTHIAHAHAEREDGWKPDCAEVALELAKLGEQELAKSLLAEAEAKEALLESIKMPTYRTMARVVSTYGVLRSPDAAQRLLELLSKMREARSDKGWLVASAISTIVHEYPDFVADRNAWEEIVSLGAQIEDTADRSRALLAIIEAAATAGKFKEAVRLLPLVVVVREQATAIELLARKLTPEAPIVHVEQGREVLEVFLNVARQNVSGLLRCAEVWADVYLNSRQSPPEFDTAVASLLSEIDFVRKN
jgi:hypothetical protein